MNRKWLIRTAVAVFAVGGALLGSYVHAHAATTAARTAPSVVVYGTQGNGGWSDPRVKPGGMVMENGGINFRRTAWPSKWGKASVTSKRAQERECSSNGCTNWHKVSVKFYSIKVHRQKNIGGGYIKIRYYSKLVYTATPGGNPIWLYFDTGSGTKQPVWYQPYCSIHGGPCTASHARLLAAMVPQAVALTARGHLGHCHWVVRGSKNQGTVRLQMVRDTCRRTQLRIRAAGVGVVSGFHAGNWIFRLHQLTSINISPDVYSDYGLDYQYNWPKGSKHRGRVHYVSLDNGA